MYGSIITILAGVYERCGYGSTVWMKSMGLVCSVSYLWLYRESDFYYYRYSCYYYYYLIFWLAKTSGNGSS